MNGTLSVPVETQVTSHAWLMLKPVDISIDHNVAKLRICQGLACEAGCRLKTTTRHQDDAEHQHHGAEYQQGRLRPISSAAM